MDRVTKIPLTRTPDCSESSDAIHTPDSPATSISDSATSSWSDGTTTLTPKSAANGSVALTVATSMTSAETQPLPAPVDCTPGWIAAHLPTALSGVTLAAGFVMTTVGGIGINGAYNAAPPKLFYEGLVVGGGVAMIIGFIAGMMTMPAHFDNRQQQTNPA